MKKILFVCLGNICRSPMAEYLLRQIADERGLNAKSASAGTSGWHDGEGMHQGTAKVLKGLGITSNDFTSRRVRDTDFAEFDYLIAMDDDNLRELEKRFGRHPKKIFQITELSPQSGYSHVPDPWYTHNFEETRQLLTTCCTILADKLQRGEM